jgi:hypothetical protein
LKLEDAVLGVLIFCTGKTCQQRKEKETKTGIKRVNQS